MHAPITKTVLFGYILYTVKNVSDFTEFPQIIIFFTFFFLIKELHDKECEFKLEK